MAKIRKIRKYSRRKKKGPLQEAKARFSEIINKLKNLRKPKNTLLDFFSKSRV